MSDHEEIKPIKVLNHQDIRFLNPIDDVYIASQPISGAACIDTHDGLVLIDTLINDQAAKEFKKKLKETVKSKVKFIIYTHGHRDHIGGTEEFLDDNPEIIANKYLTERLEKYNFLAPHIAHTKAVQFNVPEIISDMQYVYPTKEISGNYSFKLGDITFELYTARAETDDIVWVYIPELRSAFVGDLIIGSFPNIGNPWKPTRFALDWAKTLVEVRNKQPEYLFYNGAAQYYKGKRAKKALDLNIELIQSLHDQVVDCINKGMHITEMIHDIIIPNHLKKSNYLKEIYSRVEFFVFNVYRWYHGYYDDNPANLLPRPEKEVKREIVNLIGDHSKIIERVEMLFQNDQSQLALQVLDFLIQTNPKDIKARTLRIKILEKLGNLDYCLMSRNAWVYYIEKDREFIKNLELDTT